MMPKFTSVKSNMNYSFRVSVFERYLSVWVALWAENITTRWFHVVLIAIPIILQVYFNSSLTYGLMKLFRVHYAVAAPGALIGASNFFELAVATAITL